MIDLDDLNPHAFPLTENQEQNLFELAEKLTKLESAFGALFKITSGFRSISDHYRIYKAKGIEHPPMGSRHLTAQAADIYDPHKTLQEWCLTEHGLGQLEDLGLWCELFEYTLNWVHFQICPPASGKRFFKP